MPRKQAYNLLKTASALVPCGIYGIEKDGYMQLMNVPMTPAEVKQKRREYGRKGIKVHYNV